ncbi:hypothetical protein ACV34R_30700, partial [Pseudomonas aeruginosa]
EAGQGDPPDLRQDDAPEDPSGRQAERLAGLGNLYLILLKDTALVSLITLDEIMRKAQVASNATKEPFTFYMTAAAIYLSLTVVIMVALHFLERRAG